MDKDQLKHITHVHYRKLGKELRLVKLNPGAESIHRFRVEYKKLRAVLRMLCCAGNGKSCPVMTREMVKLYKVSGQIRDLLLQQQRVLEETKSSPKKPTGYISILERELDRLLPDMMEKISSKSLRASREKTDRLLPSGFSALQFREYLAEKKSSIIFLIRSAYFTDEIIHEIRKKLKDIFYASDIYMKDAKHPVPAALWPASLANPRTPVTRTALAKSSKKYEIATLLDDLGCFQDRCTSIALVKTQWVSGLKTYSRELMEQVKRAWIRKKIVQKRRLVEILDTRLAIIA